MTIDRLRATTSRHRTTDVAPAPASAPTPSVAPVENPAPAAAEAHRDGVVAEFARARETAADGVNRQSPLAARLNNLRNVSATTRAGDGADSVDSALEVGTLTISSPSGVGTPEVDPQIGRSVSRGAHGVSIGTGRHMGGADGGTTDSISGSLSRGGVSVDGSRTHAGRSLSIGASGELGWLSTYGSLAWAGRNGGASSVGGYIGGWTGSLTVGGDLTRTNAAGRTGSIGGYLTGSASRSLSDLGNYEGSEASLKGTRKIEVRHSTGRGGAINGGAAASVLGIGGTLTVDKEREVVFRTHVAPERARTLLHSEEGVVRFLKDKGRALGLVEEPVEIPDPADPASLKIGDELVVSTSGSISLGVAVGGYGARVGMQGVARGDFEIGVRRMDANRVELCLTPSEIRGFSVFADAPLVLDARATRMLARALRQAFVFDLSNPEGKAAYERALKGELPGALQDLKAGGGTEADLAKAVRNETLPAGVERSYLERVELKRTRAGIGLNFGPFQEGGLVGGFGVHTIRSHEVRTITDGHAALLDTTRMVERRREVLLSGTETAGITGSLRTSATYADDGTATGAFHGLTLRAHFSDSRVRGDELNDEMVDRINHALGSAVPHFTAEGRGTSREISIERTLKAEDFNALTTHDPVHLADTARATGASEPALQRLAAALRASTDPAERAQAVQRFVADEGLAGMGALHRLLGGDQKQLAITTTSDAYQDPTEKASQLALKYARPIAVGDAPGDIASRFEEVSRVLERAAQARLDAAEDPLLTNEEKASIDAALGKAQQTLQGLLRVDHLAPAERLQIHRAVDSGWISAADMMVLHALEAAGLP